MAFNPFAVDAPAATEEKSEPKLSFNPFADFQPPVAAKAVSKVAAPAATKAEKVVETFNPFALPQTTTTTTTTEATKAAPSSSVAVAVAGSTTSNTLQRPDVLEEPLSDVADEDTSDEEDYDDDDNNDNEVEDTFGNDDPNSKPPESKSANSSRRSSLNERKLVRTPSLSNYAQIQLMTMVRDGALSSEKAMEWAERKEKEEQVPKLGNATQIKVLTMVRDGKMTQEEAIAYADSLAQKEREEREKQEEEEDLKNFYGILQQIGDLQADEPGTSPGIVGDSFPAKSMDSLDIDMEEAKKIFDNPDEHLKIDAAKEP